MHSGVHEPRTWGQRIFRLVTTGSAAVLGLVLLAWLLAGKSVLQAAYDGRSFEWLDSVFHPMQGRVPFEEVLGDARIGLFGIVAMAVSAWAFYAALFLAWSRKRRALALPAFLLAWWFTVDFVGSRYMARVLDIERFLLIRDIDHRPKPLAPIWNSDGLAGTPEPDGFRDADLNLLFLGDSFTYGFGVRPREAFPFVCEALLESEHPSRPIQVANFAWTTSSPLLSYRRLVDVGEKYHPDMVLMCIDMSDIRDDVRWRDMLERKGVYAWFDRLPMTLDLLEWLAPDLYVGLVSRSTGGAPVERFFATEAPLEETRPWFAPLVSSLTKIESWCTERGVEFAVVVLPRAFQYSKRECPDNWEADLYTPLGPHAHAPFRFFDELSEEVDYPVVSLLEDFLSTDVFPTCFRSDPHWTPAGHRVAAGAIMEKLGPRIRSLLER